jgi:hypothetical protein
MTRIRFEKALLRPKSKKARTGGETDSGFIARHLAGSTGSGRRMTGNDCSLGEFFLGSPSREHTLFR